MTTVPRSCPLRARIVSIAQGQLGYRTDPPDTYCNKFSAYWYAGVDDCGNDNLDEEWCADFAVWGTEHGTWHPVGSSYKPQPGDVAVYGLDTSALTAVHVAIVTAGSGDVAPDVINGDGDRTGYSVVEVGDHQAFADVKGNGARLSGYVSPTSPSADSTSS